MDYPLYSCYDSSGLFHTSVPEIHLVGSCMFLADLFIYVWMMIIFDLPLSWSQICKLLLYSCFPFGV